MTHADIGEMVTTLEQYRQAKQDISKLHGAAKKELVARFSELANELLLVQKELRDEFGLKLTIPAKPKAARVKKSATPAKKEAETPSSTKTAAIEKKLALQKKKLDDASRAGKPDKVIRDRIYELEDELRLAKEK